ncbi:MAG: hypothetical protein HY904_14340 [Deltaproteobacteria bacterium]|nr:hypothetical protein [Deltaproteobacteria bacterium]
MRRHSPLLLALPLFACTQPDGNSSSSSGQAPPPVYQQSQGLKSCTGATLEAGKPLETGQRCYTYRAIGGVSMGGGSAARVAFHYPELFDAVGVMGTPFSDFDSFYEMLKTNHLGGFCDRETLLGIMNNSSNPDVLNEPATPGLWCGVHGADIPGPLAEPDSQCWMFRSDFNHWYRGPDVGRGGGFKRPGLVEIIQDIFSTYGNIAFYNPDNPYLPPGVPLSGRVAPGLDSSARAAARAALCANPTVLTNFRHYLWNPTGEYPVITFCDCDECEGDVDPTKPMNLPTEVLLAVDYNRNNKRDWGEPVLFMGHEPYRDVGTDGKAPGEAGDDAGDDYDYLANPHGLEANARWDEGEPFDDVGLDGIPGTGDFGEGDGVLTMTPSLERALHDSPTRWYERMDDAMANRLDIWMDAGIRDFINSAQVTNHLFGAIKARQPDSRQYRDFADLGNLPDGNTYSFTKVDFSEANLGKNAYLLYGDPDICPGSDSQFGSGNHVGPANQVIDRLLTLFAFVDARMPFGDRTYINSDSAFDDHPDGFGAHLLNLVYPSAALGREQPFGLVLPPGYFYPENAEKRYPVIYFMHGQGQNARDLVASGFVFMAYQFQSSDGITPESDMQKFILVFADGECHGDDCHTGNFYSNFQGMDGNGPQFETAFIELMQHVDANWRTRFPEVH